MLGAFALGLDHFSFQHDIFYMDFKLYILLQNVYNRYTKVPLLKGTALQPHKVDKSRINICPLCLYFSHFIFGEMRLLLNYTHNHTKILISKILLIFIVCV